MADIHRFVKEKTKTMLEHSRAMVKMNNALAGQGFSFEPGFAYDAVTNFEIDTKLKLSAINYTILNDAIVRELKQSDLDYDLAYRDAALIWESDKQALLRAWDQELIDMKRENALEEEEVKRLAIEVGLRAITLIEAKTALDLQMEALRLEIAELDGSTVPYEVQLAQAKVLTANKKLELIPFIEQLIEIEWDIIGQEQIIANKETIISGLITNLANKDTELASKLLELVTKKQETITAETSLISTQQDLVTARADIITEEENLLTAEEAALATWTAEVYPATIALLNKMEEYIVELETQLSLYDDIYATKLETVALKEEGITKQQLILAAERNLTSAMAELTVALEGLADYRQSTVAPELSNLLTVLNEYIAGPLDQQLAFRIQIANTRAAIELLTEQKVAKEILVAEAEVNQSEARIYLSAANLAIRELNNANRLEDATNALDNIIAYATELLNVRNNIMSTRESTFAGILDKEKTLELDKIEFDTNEKLRLDDKQVENLYDEENLYEDFLERKTTLETTKAITATLQHLLSQE